MTHFRYIISRESPLAPSNKVDGSIVKYGKVREGAFRVKGVSRPTSEFILRRGGGGVMKLP